MASTERAPSNASEASDVRFSEVPSTPSSRAPSEVDVNGGGGSGSYRISMGMRDSTDRRPRVTRATTLNRLSSALIGSNRSSLEKDQEDVMRDIVIQFNMKAKTGVKLLLQHTPVPPEAEARQIANFLYHTEGLSKRRIGEYVGNMDQLNQAVLEAYLTFFQFEHLELDEAMRILLRAFRLPGEAQQVDRILEKFGARYNVCNPGKYGPDVTYILSFSIILLNTDLYNENLDEKKRMTFEGFKRNNRGIDDGKDIDEAVLRNIFDRIKNEEITMDEADLYESECITFVGATRAGWLTKQGKGTLWGDWKQHWFVLNEHCLYYFKNAGDSDPRCIIPLQAVEAKGHGSRGIILSRTDGKNLKTVKHLDNGRLEQGDHRSLTIRAKTQEERDNWLEDIKKEIQDDPLQEYLNPKAAKLRKSESRNSISRGAASGNATRHSGLSEVTKHWELPPPIAEGWMRKRGEFNRDWKRRYFVLCDIPDTGRVLFYFGSPELAHRMVKTGDATHKGAVFLRKCTGCRMEMVPGKDEPAIDLITSDRVWSMVPASQQEFAFWLDTFNKSIGQNAPLLRSSRGSLGQSNGAAAEDGPLASPRSSNGLANVREEDEGEPVATYDFSTDKEILVTLSVGELKSIMLKYGISRAGCVEKGDMVEAICAAGMAELKERQSIPVPPSVAPPAPPPPPGS